MSSSMDIVRESKKSEVKKSEDFDINSNAPIDIDKLIENAKMDQLKLHAQFKAYKQMAQNKVNAKHSQQNGNHHKDWSQIKDEKEAKAKKRESKVCVLRKLLGEEIVDSDKLRSVCWRGIPNCMRGEVWKVLLGYVPKNLSQRETSLGKKRKEYSRLIERYYNHDNSRRSVQEQSIIRQISLDVPRTSPELKIFQLKNISVLLTRSLYIWSLRHAATGYVQGINDLITPFVFIFLNDYLKQKHHVEDALFHTLCHAKKTKTKNGKEEAPGKHDILHLVSEMDEKELLFIEADSYMCLDHLIESLQMNYTQDQPGIQSMIEQLESVVHRIDPVFNDHLKSQNVLFIQFSFRWMNCLLMRELSLQNIIRLWDTYLCEGVQLSAGFTEFHVFVCAALLLQFKEELMEKDFADIMLFLQSLQSVTAKWTEKEIETILSQAFVFQQLFGKSKKSLY